jgi:signal transduction histidine kinase
VVVVIADDGIGFDLSAVTAQCTGFGLLSIQESLKRLDGHMEITTEQGVGCETILRVSLPVEEQVKA